MKKQFTPFHTLLLVLAAFALSYCDKKNTEEETEALKKEALEQYASLVLANYDDCISTVETFKQTVDAFLAAPSQTTFDACKSAWLAARNPYGQSEAFRFYGGPIDDGDGPEGLINAWPMDEVFVDYVVGDPAAGIINNPAQYPGITKELLIGLNELFSEESIFSGYHAAEFLLWGQDLSTTGPGERPYTDFVTGAGGTAANQDRRGLYLRVATDLLIDNLNEVRNEWIATGAYRQQFLHTFETRKALGLLFSGLGEFTKGEVSGERMYVAIDVADQEHEHSCFSDNTIADLKMNLIGVKNVYYGTYTKVNGGTVSGRSFAEIVQKLDPAGAAAVDAAFADAIAKMDAIPAPFDQTIVNNPVPVETSIETLRTLSDRLLDAGRAIGAQF
jgi:putative iron-regulated protein